MYRNNRGARPFIPRNRRGPLHHRIFVVDIENVIGHAASSTEEVTWARTLLASRLGITSRDQVVLGTSHYGFIHVATGWPGARYVVRSGPDGADLALLDVLGESLESRYAEVVLVTGDGIFTDEAAALSAAGVIVTVASHASHLSRGLRKVAKQVIYLSDQPESVTRSFQETA